MARSVASRTRTAYHGRPTSQAKAALPAEGKQQDRRASLVGRGAWPHDVKFLSFVA
jgi:hypothetical protein